jgi:capsular polysaccharide biosynthesis protein
MPLLEQISLVRGADIIVAPHGMGLTHIAFHNGKPLIIELHNTCIGSDSYAFMAHALGFKYHAIMGKDQREDPFHFEVAPVAVIDVLAREGISDIPVSSTDSALDHKFCGGTQSKPAIVDRQP